MFVFLFITRISCESCGCRHFPHSGSLYILPNNDLAFIISNVLFQVDFYTLLPNLTYCYQLSSIGDYYYYYGIIPVLVLHSQILPLRLVHILLDLDFLIPQLWFPLLLFYPYFESPVPSPSFLLML